MNADKKQRMLDVVRKYHGAQTRNNGRIPYWHHCVSTAEILETALSQTKELEGNDELLLDLFLSALGHDLYEDTEIRAEEIQLLFGPRVDSFIHMMTNSDGDFHRDNYHTQIESAPEEVKLIKLADMIDNTLSCAYGVHDLGPDWIREKYLPHVTEMRPFVRLESFQQYPRAARSLLEHLDFAFSRLLDNLKKYQTS